ncbi:MAG: glycosyltransferase family 39 protein [Anaerolineae bacterium]
MFTNNPRRTRIAFLAVLAVYLVLGGLYAVKTPIWQVPDEPAHYNYIRYIAENLALPELKQGDFPYDWLSLLKQYKFENLSIDRVKYESHQPPLYYVLGTAAYAIASSLRLQIPLILRFFSLALGAVAFWLGYRVIRTIFPDEPLLALGTASFLATLPMHLTMNMGINNDVLVELLLALIVGQVVLLDASSWSWKKALLLGVLLGLALLTKVQAFISVVVVLAALLYDLLQSHKVKGALSWSKAFGFAGLLLGVAGVIILPWLVRNASIYGLGDLLALQRHDQVASRQLATGIYIQQVGIVGYLVSFATTTFQSFWGQFGWMGVVLHPRFYLAALFLTGLVLLGFVLYVVRTARSQDHLAPATRRGLLILLIWGVCTLLGYLWYNTKFVQFQGRYLFPAIIPLGLVFTLGFRELFRGNQFIPLAAIGLVVLYLVGDGIVQRDLKLFSTVIAAAAAPLLVAGKRLEKWLPGVAMAVMYLVLAAYSLYCLFAYIVPQLSIT